LWDVVAAAMQTHQYACWLLLSVLAACMPCMGVLVRHARSHLCLYCQGSGGARPRATPGYQEPSAADANPQFTDMRIHDVPPHAATAVARLHLRASHNHMMVCHSGRLPQHSFMCNHTKQDEPANRGLGPWRSSAATCAVGAAGFHLGHSNPVVRSTQRAPQHTMHRGHQADGTPSTAQAQWRRLTQQGYTTAHLAPAPCQECCCSQGGCCRMLGKAQVRIH
jgi:hypothetical protein